VPLFSPRSYIPPHITIPFLISPPFSKFDVEHTLVAYMSMSSFSFINFRKMYNCRFFRIPLLLQNEEEINNTAFREIRISKQHERDLMGIREPLEKIPWYLRWGTKRGKYKYT